MHRLKKQFCRIRMTMLICMLVLLCCPLLISAESAPVKNVIRDGFPIQGGLSRKSEQGEYSGYTYDYLQEIAQYTGWEYEFVEIPGDVNESLTAMLEMLTKGEIDIMGGMVKNAQTQQLWDFPEHGYGFNYKTLGVLEENTRITENNYQGIDNLRIAVYKNATTTISKLEAFSKANNITYTLVPCENTDAMVAALNDNSADALLGNDLTPIKGIRTIACFDGSQYYFAIPKGNAKLLGELNRTILTIQQVKPGFESYLYDTYFSNRSDELYFSDEEQAFIRTSAPIKIAVMMNHAPIQFMDYEGNLKGILVELLKRIESEVGLKFELVPVESYDAAYRLMDEGVVNAVCGIPYDYKLAQKHEMIMSSSLFQAQMVLVTKDKAEKNFAGEEAGVIDRGIAEANRFASPEDCLNAVKQGSIEAGKMNLYTAEYMTRYGKYKKLLLIPQTGSVDVYCIGIRKPANPAFVSIIGKVMSALPGGELETIIYQNTAAKTREFTVKDFIEENPFWVLGLISGLFSILVIIGYLIVRIRIRAAKILKVENQRYLQLCRLANEFIFEYDCKKDVITFSGEFSKLFSVPETISAFSRIISGKNTNGAHLNPDIIVLFRSMIFSQMEDGAEFPCRMSNGEQRWYRSTWGKIQDADGTDIYIIGKLTDVQEEKEEKEHLERQLLLDGLTGIYNTVASRNLISERLAELSGQGALMIIDIDNFKEVNDHLGHYTGDIVLKDLAQLLIFVSNPWDVAGRLGGDEFILFIHSCESSQELAALCHMLCEKARKNYTNKAGNETTITISIGASLVRKTCDFSELYQRVDKNMYASKMQGRDRYTIVEDSEMG